VQVAIPVVLTVRVVITFTPLMEPDLVRFNKTRITGILRWLEIDGYVLQRQFIFIFERQLSFELLPIPRISVCYKQTVFSIFTKGERIVCSVCMRLAPELDCLTHFVVIIWRSSFEQEMGCRRLGRPNEGGNIKDDRSMPAQASLKSGKKNATKVLRGVFSKKGCSEGCSNLRPQGSS